MGALVALTAVLALSACGGTASAPIPTIAATEPAPTVTPTPTPTAAPTPTIDVPRIDAGTDNQVPTTVAPTTVSVGELDVTVSVRPEALAADGSMALPEDPAIASWYRYGSGPASPAGATVIAAHVDAVGYDIGPFSRLTRAQPGTVVTVTSEDGSEHRYAVDAVEVADKSGVPWDTVFDRTGPPRLVLITCGGEFDSSTGHYRSNIIVTAQLLP